MIFYFSATGNGLDISRRLADALDDDIRNIVDEVEGDCRYVLREGERVGIVAPTHFYGLPLIVEDFIKKMSFDREPYLYLVLSYGSTLAQAMERAERTFGKNGYRLNAKLAVRMPENYVLMFNPPSESDVRRILSSAYDVLGTFLTFVEGYSDVDMTVRPTLGQRMTGTIAKPMYVYGRGTGRFYVDGICTGCGRCVRICPSDAIELVDRIPTWTKSRCLRCCACINRCPVHALQFGRSTRKRGRYVNPNVELKE